ncbi:molybdopterin-guanine dinucleotide biosynthesis protein MobA [Rubripirellula lacrimiformis]|uniref:Molybdopterin-guanine dinucleotide biosynthesis protein MobA n=1 Tax=Rubripirellula lacrimiformis TaxID=1930273 RepID=A0A517N5H3_9BACT|nr:molybdenum cofactor guanylyltransferase [Rubripirellula lacrimiformis]QDT02278.1 molybdopterin-guanine dinucleotide biosynthesis protein MobA [Rubripirellula lacrimiformis]
MPQPQPDPPPERRLLGIVLCGGQSTRMGRDKSDLPHPSGGTYLEQAIDRLGPLCDGVAISGPHASDSQTPAEPPRDAGITRIPDPARAPDDVGGGPAVGIAASLGYALEHGFVACLFTPVDTPNLGATDLAKIKAAWTNHRQSVIAMSDRMEPLIAIYAASQRNTIAELAESEDRSLYRFLQSKRIPFTCVTLDRQKCHNINTPDEFESHGR